MMVYGEIQQWLYLFLPYKALPRIDEARKDEIKQIYESMLRSHDCPASHIERIEQTIHRIDYQRPQLYDHYYNDAISYHTQRITQERKERWDAYELRTAGS